MPQLKDEATRKEHPLAEVNISSSSHLEDDRLIARARAVAVDYEFAKPGEVETEDDRRKRQWRNQRRISEQEKRLREVVGVDLPPTPPAGSSQQEDNFFSLIFCTGTITSIPIKYYYKYTKYTSYYT